MILWLEGWVQLERALAPLLPEHRLAVRRETHRHGRWVIHGDRLRWVWVFHPHRRTLEKG